MSVTPPTHLVQMLTQWEKGTVSSAMSSLATGQPDGAKSKEAPPTCLICEQTVECTLKNTRGGSKVVLRDMYSGVCKRTIRCDEDVQLLCVSNGEPDEAIYTGDSRAKIRKWDANTGEHLDTWSGHEKMVTCLVFDAQERILASGSADRTIRLWKSDGQCVRVIKAHSLMVTCLAMSAENGWLFSGSGDKTVKKWSIKSGELLATMQGFELPVVKVEVSERDNLILAKEWCGVNTLQFTMDTGVMVGVRDQGNMSTIVVLL